MRDPQAAAQMKGRKLLAFAGIGHPQKFFATLRSLGAVVSEARSFADHHRYGAAEARELLETAKAGGLMLVIFGVALNLLTDRGAPDDLAQPSEVV